MSTEAAVWEDVLSWLLREKDGGGEKVPEICVGYRPYQTRIRKMALAAKQTVSEREEERGGALLLPVSLMGVCVCFLTDTPEGQSPQDFLAAVQILSLSLPFVSERVLDVKMEDLCSLLEKILSDNVASQPMCFALLRSFRPLLSKQPLVKWQTSSSLLSSLKLLLALTNTLPKSANQKETCETIGAILREIRLSIDRRQKEREKVVSLPKSVCVCLKNYLQLALEKCLSSPEVDEVEKVLNLIHEVLGYLPASTISSISEQLLNILLNTEHKSPYSRNQSVLLSVISIFRKIFQMHQAFVFSFRDEEKEEIPVAIDLPLGFLTKFEEAFLRFPFQSSPPPVVSPAALLLSSAHHSLFLFSPEAAHSTLSKVFSSLFQLFGLDQFRYSCDGVGEALIEIVLNTIDDRTVFECASSIGPVPLRSVLETMEMGFSFPYRPSFPTILNLYSHLFLVCGKESKSLLSGVLNRLCEQQESQFKEEKGNFLASSVASTLLSTPYAKNLHSVIGAAVRGMGLSLFLEVLPLDLPSTNDPRPFEQFLGKRTWLLPIIKENIMPGSGLSVFVQKILPMIDALKKKEKDLSLLVEGGLIEMAEEDEVVLTWKRCKNVGEKLWGLFPCFCICPIDVEEQFKKLAKRLGMGLKEENEIRPTICLGLSSLIDHFHYVTSSQEPREFPDPWFYVPNKHHQRQTFTKLRSGGSLEEWASHSRYRCLVVSIEDAEKGEKSVKRFQQNFLPVIFNAITSASPEQAAHLHSVLSSFLSIVTRKEAVQYYGSVIAKIKASEKEKEEEMEEGEKGKEKGSHNKVQVVLLNLVIDFIPHVHEENGLIGELVKLIRPFTLQTSELGLQKKAYKVLLAICSHASSYVQENATSQLQAIITDQLATCSAASKSVRLRCLEAILLTLVKKAKTEPPRQQKQGKFQQQSQMAVITPTLRHFITETISELLMCTKEHSAKCRGIAGEVLVTYCVCFPVPVGHGLSMFGGKSKEEGKKGKGFSLKIPEENFLYPLQSSEFSASVDAFFKLVIGGLAGKTYFMISATLTSLTLLLRHFRRIVNTEIITTLISSCVILLSLESKEIQKSALYLIRISIGKLTGEELGGLLGGLVGGLFGVQELKEKKVSEDDIDDIDGEEEDHAPKQKRTTKKEKHLNANGVILIRYILEKLIRKCGLENVIAVTPETHLPLVNNVRKRMMRTEKKIKKAIEGRKRDETGGEGEKRDYLDSNSFLMPSGISLDQEMEDLGKEEGERGGKKKKEREGERKKKRKGGEFMIKEGEELDLLDSDMTDSFLKLKKGPGGEKRMREEEKLEFNEEGKLIIPMEEEEGRKRKSERRQEKVQTPQTHQPPSKKRKGVPQSGSEYRSKKAKGDVKVKGKMDPYAFLAVDERMLNKRFRKKEAKKFESLMQNKKEGKRKK